MKKQNKRVNNVIKIYAMPIHLADISQENLRNRIAKNRLNEIEKRAKNAQLQSFAASILLDEAMRIEGLSEQKPLQWRYAEKGKPYLSEYPNVHFSISHSADYAACALSDKPIGIDLQKESGDKMHLAVRFFHEKEVHALQNLHGKEQMNLFYDIWTMKESLAKMLGTELGRVLGRVWIDCADEPQIKSPTEYQHHRLTVLTPPAANYHLAICTQQDEPKPEYKMITKLKKD